MPQPRDEPTTPSPTLDYATLQPQEPGDVSDRCLGWVGMVLACAAMHFFLCVFALAFANKFYGSDVEDSVAQAMMHPLYALFEDRLPNILIAVANACFWGTVWAALISLVLRWQRAR